MPTVTVGMNGSNVTVNTSTVTATGAQGNVTWTLDAGTPAGWTIGNVTINKLGNSPWPGGNPGKGNNGKKWSVPGGAGNSTQTFTYTVSLVSGTSTRSLDPEIVNAPPSGW